MLRQGFIWAFPFILHFANDWNLYIILPLTLSVNCMFVNVPDTFWTKVMWCLITQTRFSWNKTHFVTSLVSPPHLHWSRIVYPRLPGDRWLYWKIPLKALLDFFYLSLSFYSKFWKIIETFIFYCRSVFWLSVNHMFMNVNVWHILMIFYQS